MKKNITTAIVFAGFATATAAEPLTHAEFSRCMTVTMPAIAQGWIVSPKPRFEQTFDLAWYETNVADDWRLLWDRKEDIAKRALDNPSLYLLGAAGADGLEAGTVGVTEVAEYNAAYTCLFEDDIEEWTALASNADMPEGVTVEVLPYTPKPPKKPQVNVPSAEDLLPPKTK